MIQKMININATNSNDDEKPKEKRVEFLDNKMMVEHQVNLVQLVVGNSDKQLGAIKSPVHCIGSTIHVQSPTKYTSLQSRAKFDTCTDTIFCWYHIYFTQSYW
jgi:hypothetical protein